MKRLIKTIFLLSLASCSLTTKLPAPIPEEYQLSLASWNIENFTRSESRKLKLIGRTLAESLHSPDIIAFQEVMDDSGRRDDGTTEGDRNFAALAKSLEQISGEKYGFISYEPQDGKEGGVPGGNIRTGYLYKTASLKPTGPGEVWEDEVFSSCRPPFSQSFLFNERTLTVINVHLSSRIGGEYSDWKRLNQAHYLSEKMTSLLQEDRNRLIILTGDFNDTPNSPPILSLTTGPKALIGLVENPTYLYKGQPLQLDHILASGNMARRCVSAGVLTLHGGADLPSDHNPLLAQFYLPPPEQEVTPIQELRRVFSTISLTPGEGDAESMDSRAFTISDFWPPSNWRQR